MKKLTFILLIFFCLNVSGQHTFTYTEIKASINHVDEFIEKLIVDKNFVLFQKYTTSRYVDCIKFVSKDYKSYTDEIGMQRVSGSIWVNIYRKTLTYEIENAEVSKMIEINFAKASNYKYLIGKIKQYCKKIKFSYNDSLKTYVSYYEHPDSVAFVFYKGSLVDGETTGNHVIQILPVKTSHVTKFDKTQYQKKILYLLNDERYKKLDEEGKKEKLNMFFNKTTIPYLKKQGVENIESYRDRFLNKYLQEKKK